jgi:hypothetical protein
MAVQDVRVHIWERSEGTVEDVTTRPTEGNVLPDLVLPWALANDDEAAAGVSSTSD